jgi:hypothetical protein
MQVPLIVKVEISRDFQSDVHPADQCRQRGDKERFFVLKGYQVSEIRKTQFLLRYLASHIRPPSGLRAKAQKRAAQPSRKGGQSLILPLAEPEPAPDLIRGRKT